MSFSIREKYSIPKDGKVLLYVGNISDNKNQRQMVEAYGLLPPDVRDNIWVLFCGRPSLDGGFEKMVLDYSYSSHLIICGEIERSDIPNYYREADGVVLLSFVEGFGLSLIEGMHFGLPCAMFIDMAAYEDIYDEQSVVAISDRKNSSVAEALIQLVSKKWNKKQIITASKRFDALSMAERYISVYELL